MTAQSGRNCDDGQSAMRGRKLRELAFELVRKIEHELGDLSDVADTGISATVAECQQLLVEIRQIFHPNPTSSASGSFWAERTLTAARKSHSEHSQLKLPRRRVAARQAAVDDQRRAVDVARLVRGEEQRGLRDLDRLAAAPKRVELADAVLLAALRGPCRRSAWSCRSRSGRGRWR